MTDGAERIEVYVGPDSAKVLVERLDDGRYRVAECPWLFEEFGYDDIIKVELDTDSAGRFVGVERASVLRRSSFVLSARSAESPRLADVLEAVVAEGGYWERAFGGLLFTALPPDSSLNVAALLEQLIAHPD